MYFLPEVKNQNKNDPKQTNKKTTEVPDRIFFSRVFIVKNLQGENTASVKREKWEYSFCLFVCFFLACFSEFRPF